MRGGSSGRFGVLCLAFVALAAVFVGLGRWQLDRAAEARAVGERFSERAELEPVTDVAAAARRPLDALHYRELRLEGRYGGAQVLLDNITRHGAAGYYVLTPFEPAAGGPAVLVNRGWIEADPDRGVVRPLDVGTGRRVVSGRIDRLPRAALSLGGAGERVRDGLYRASFPSIGELEALLGRELAPFQVLLDPSRGDGFERTWTPDTSRADTNTAYAGQWFIMAVGACALAGWAAWRAYRAARRETRADETQT